MKRTAALILYTYIASTVAYTNINALPVSYADGQQISAEVSDNMSGFSDLQKKKRLKYDETRANNINGLVAQSMSTVLGPLSSHIAALSAKASRHESNDEMSDEGAMQRRREIKKRMQEQQFLYPHAYAYSSYSVQYPSHHMDEYCKERGRIKAEEENKKKGYGTDMIGGFYHVFDKIAKNLPNPAKFVEKGIKNAKKNLMSSALLARAYASTAAKNTMESYENTLRSSKMLKDLVKRGLISSAAAAKELAASIKDTSKEYLSAGANSVKGASKYLLSTSLSTVGSMLSGIKYSPGALAGISLAYPEYLKSKNYKLPAIPSLSINLTLEKDLMKKWLTPTMPPVLGNMWTKMQGSIQKVREQWDSMSSAASGMSKEQRARFFAMTEELARTLDALEVRLGRGVEFTLPGTDMLRDKVVNVLADLVNTNTQAMSGAFSFSKLLEYSTGASKKLQSMNDRLYGLLPSNPMKSLGIEPFSSMTKMAVGEISGIRNKIDKFSHCLTA